jgi:polyisoprenoid-binding protein YceI
MSTETVTTEVVAAVAAEVPAGSWTVDPVHSAAGFAVSHMLVGTFRGEFAEIEGSLIGGKLVGRVKVESLHVKADQLKGHLLSPDFFDAEHHPEIVFESSSLSVSDGALTANGTLTAKGIALPVTATGRVAGPVVGLGDVDRIGIDLETTIELEALGLGFNAPLPRGGFVLGKTVTITVTLELSRADED